jgi:hypothetical protein
VCTIPCGIVTQQLPVYTKTAKSKSWFAAGWYRVGEVVLADHAGAQADQCYNAMNMQDHSIQKVMPMTIHLQKFVDRVRGQEARGARDFVMTMNEARDLHADITRCCSVYRICKNRQQNQQH